MHTAIRPSRRVHWFIGCAAVLVLGCGTMKSQVATEQLLISDAIERAADQFDFSLLSGSTVYLDTQYMSKVTAQGFLNSDYIRSALRQRLMRCNCRLAEAAADATYVVEVRVGALGTDSHEVNYGIPASQPLSSTAAIFSGSALPALPEVSLAKKNERRGAAKLHVFAYHRETMEPVWQPDVSHGKSSARSTWVFGAGPFEKGTIYDRARFAGATLDELEVNQLAPESLRAGLIGDVLGNSISAGSNILTGLLPVGGADLRDANIRDANIRDANIRDADIRDADIRNASIREAGIREAGIGEAGLTERTPVDEAKLESAIGQPDSTPIEVSQVPAFAIPVAIVENAKPIQQVSHTEAVEGE